MAEQSPTSDAASNARRPNDSEESGIDPAVPKSIQLGSDSDPWLDSRLTLRPELKFDTRSENRTSFVIIEDPIRNKFFQIGPREYQFIASLDGKNTPREVLQQHNRTLDEQPAYDQTTAVSICQWLIHSNLVSGESIDNASRLSAQSVALQRNELMGLLNPISFKIKLFNPNRLLSRIQPYTQWLFSTWFFVVWCAVAAYSLCLILTQWDRMAESTVGILSGYSWIWVLLIWIVLKLVHEISHGVACRRYGGEVPETGVLLLLFTPIAYVNVTSMWRFPNRLHRMVVAAAGMYVELFISFAALIFWDRTTGVASSIAFNVFLMSSVTTLLFNANPLMRFDGYFLLSDYLKIPNLYSKGINWFGSRFRNLVFGVPITSNVCDQSETGYVAVYGTLAVIWKLSISISLLIGASVLFHGLGLLLALVGGSLWFGAPLYRQFKSFSESHPSSRPRLVRTCLSFGLFGLAGIGVFWVLKAPATKSAPAIVQFEDLSIVRADVDGFVSRVLVDDGDTVSAGQPLMVLDNPTLANEVEELKRLADESQIQYRIFKQQQKLALALAELKKHEELNNQLAEKRAAAKGLIVSAPRDGFVFERNLANCVGSFVKRGDSLLSIGQSQSKEIIVSIDQRDLESLKGNEGTVVRVAMPGTPVFETQLARVNPRASERPTHLALCANIGGPLDVRPVNGENQSAESSVELLSPRFNAILRLTPDSSGRLQSGQRGRAFFLTCDQSLGDYCYLAAKDWLERKIEIATQSAVF